MLSRVALLFLLISNPSAAPRLERLVPQERPPHARAVGATQLGHIAPLTPHAAASVIAPRTEENAPPAAFPRELLGLKGHFKADGDFATGILVNNRANGEQWSRHFPGRGLNRAYRVMNATPADLRTILRVGIEPSSRRFADERGRTTFNRVFATLEPGHANWDAMYTGFYFHPRDEHYVVLMELDRDHPKARSSTGWDAGGGQNIVFDHIYPEQFRRFFFADPSSKNPSFPFREFSADEVRKIFLAPELGPRRGADLPLPGSP
jgi:hypothetical protein